MNREKYNKRMREWRLKNLEAQREYHRNYMRRVRHSNLPVELKNKRCQVCATHISTRKIKYCDICAKNKRLERWKVFVKTWSGSRKDESWNGKNHTCCSSRVSYRHKVSCLINSDDLSDLKDI